MSVAASPPSSFSPNANVADIAASAEPGRRYLLRELNGIGEGAFE